MLVGVLEGSLTYCHQSVTIVFYLFTPHLLQTAGELKQRAR